MTTKNKYTHEHEHKQQHKQQQENQKKALPPKTRIPREKIVEEWTQLRSTIAELTDEDTEGYVSGTLWRILLMKIHESLFVEY